jgi:dTDP-4-amino-4,6-dideoxygalactose transaminase
MASILPDIGDMDDASPYDVVKLARIRSRWPVYAEDEIEAVAEVLRSGRVNSLHHGEKCAAFEAAFARMCDQPHAIALANGTLALEVALKALGIGPGDEVIVPARSFVASASCVVACGATPVFSDIDPETQGLTADLVARALTGRTKAIILVHLGGYPAAADEIALLAERHGVKLIEDCAQAHGATLGGRPVGSFGDAAAFSFCTDKIISTGGEGGMLLLRDAATARRAWSLKDHGKDQQDAHAVVAGHGFRWLHREFGSNYRLTEMQAAIGLAQLQKLPLWTGIRRRNAAILIEELSDSAILRQVHPPENVGHAYYKFYAFVRPDTLHPRWSRDRIVEEAWHLGIPCQTGICPEIYRERAFADAGIGPERRLPVAHMLGETSLMLPVDPTLDEESCRTMGRILRSVLDEAGR